ncbi:helix-turn-helix domain-containing protein [Streptomyces sudanensis]|uniref:helix-turn-helix domain-containing protein n=1 Tax=Streptomyces sudanensis TaxID=436397 RepID=UPI0020CC6965|nr:helix-turn-helix domain-containing protein [Streptomyces sudanensis]MCP9957866.1 helix-turn-helix domain-containing protein [Streptomyces sudanensis]MCQ0001600.1 helix-turn-helix domain-containing protein [Streptomyces sudanensis]
MAEKKPSAAASPKRDVRRTATHFGVIHVRAYHSGRYTVIGNHLAQHRELSLTAIGLAAHILSLPEGAPVDIRSLAERFPEGRDRIAFALRELEAHGYVERVRERTATGRMITRTYAHHAPERADGTATAPARGDGTTAAPASPGGRGAVRADGRGAGAGVGAGAGAGAVRVDGQADGRGPERAVTPPAPVAVAPPVAAGPAPATPFVAAVLEPATSVSAVFEPAVSEPVAVASSVPEQVGAVLVGAEPVVPVSVGADPSVSEQAVPDPSVSEPVASGRGASGPGEPRGPFRAGAADLLAGLRRTDGRLILSQRDVERLVPAVTAWFERGVPATAVHRVLTTDLPRWSRTRADWSPTASGPCCRHPSLPAPYLRPTPGRMSERPGPSRSRRARGANGRSAPRNRATAATAGPGEPRRIRRTPPDRPAA